jgi:hypothetical protein
VRTTDPRTWYNNRKWRERRRLQSLAEPLCALCLAKGIARPATVADHHPPHGGDWHRFRTGKLRSLATRSPVADAKIPRGVLRHFQELPNDWRSVAAARGQK